MKNSHHKLPIIGLISAEAISAIGNQIAAVAIPILVLEYTHSPIATGIANIGNILPIFLAALIGGKAIDKFSARTLSILSDILSFLSVLALPLVFLLFREVSPLWIFALVFLGALFDPTGSAARQTLVAGLSERAHESLEKINTIRGGLENGADFIGPILGVALISLIGTTNTFYVNAASFLLCALIFLLVIPRNQHVMIEKEENTGFLPGLKFILRNAQLRTLISVGMAINFVILPFLGLLLPVLTTEILHQPALLGFAVSIFGGGATIGAFSFSKLNARFSRSFIYYGGLLLTGTSIFLLGITTNPVLIVILAGFAGLLLGAGNPLEQTVLQEQTPPHIMGQVFTVFTASRFAIGPIGLLLAGFGTEWGNVHLMFIISGVILLITALLGWIFSPVQKIAPISTTGR